MQSPRKMLAGLAAFSLAAAGLWAATATTAQADVRPYVCDGSRSVLTKVDPDGQRLAGATFEVSIAGATLGLTTTDRQGEFVERVQHHIDALFAAQGLTLDAWLQAVHGITEAEWRNQVAAAELAVEQADAAVEAAIEAQEAADEAKAEANAAPALAAAQKAVRKAQADLDAAKAAQEAGGDQAALDAAVVAAQKAVTEAQAEVAHTETALAQARTARDQAQAVHSAAVAAADAARAIHQAAEDAWFSNTDPDKDAALEAATEAAWTEYQRLSGIADAAGQTYNAAQAAAVAASSAHSDAQADLTAAQKRLKAAQDAAESGVTQSPEELAEAVREAQAALDAAKAHPAIVAAEQAADAAQAAEQKVSEARQSLVAAEAEQARVEAMTDGFDTNLAPEDIEARAAVLAWSDLAVPGSLTVTTGADGLAEVFVMGATSEGVLRCSEVSLTWTEIEAPEGFELADPVTVNGSQDREAATVVAGVDQLPVEVVDEPTTPDDPEKPGKPEKPSKPAKPRKPKTPQGG
ncbi:MAG: hypothetical protein QM628_15605 [Propionicimonas sp.]